MTIKEYLNGKVSYDSYGTYLWLTNTKGEQQMLGEIRGWGHIQNLFKTEKDAAAFQDEIGKFVAEAINEKIAKL
jgi:hypothetical protein